MKRTTLIISVVSILLLAAGGLFLLQEDKETGTRPLTTLFFAPSKRGATPAPPLTKAPTREVTYDQILKDIRAKRVQGVALSPVLAEILLVRKDGQHVRSTYPPSDEPALTERLAGSGAVIKVENPSRNNNDGSILAIALITLLVVGVFAWYYQQKRGSRGLGGHGGSLRKSAQINHDTYPQTRFSDIAGCGEAVEEVSEMLEFLRSPERFASIGAKMPSGILLYGPPGTGKTLLAKALAGEAGMAFFAVSGSDFVDRYVGVGASRVRELFVRAKKEEKGAVIFIDEMDAVGKARGAGGDGANDEREGTLNQLLAELDGFTGRERIICVAATNRLEILDPALLRSGRFSRHVHVDVPNEKGRMEILRLYAHGKPFDEAVDLARLAKITNGSSGAVLEDMINEAAIMAARDRRTAISQHDLEEGHLRVLAGPEKHSSLLSEREKNIVAYHEAGHALVAELCPTQDKVQRVTIKPRGRAAGLAVSGATDRALQSTQYIHERLMHILGGRAAEHVIFQTVTSGAANDLQHANTLARQAVEELGLSPQVGQLVASGSLSPEIRAIIDREVERIVAEAYAHAIALLEEHTPALIELATVLGHSEDIDRMEIVAALGEYAHIEQTPPAPPSNRRPRLGPHAHPVLTLPPVSRSRAARLRAAFKRPAGHLTPPVARRGIIAQFVARRRRPSE